AFPCGDRRADATRSGGGRADGAREPAGARTRARGRPRERARPRAGTPAPASRGGGVTTENGARASVVDVSRRMTPLGSHTGPAGNVSLRWHRGAEDGLLVTPSALAYERMTIDDIVWLPVAVPDDEDPLAESPLRVHGTRSPSSEWRLHRDLYA